jgi:hypothetical protein
MTYPPSGVPAFVFWLMPDEDPQYEDWPLSTLLRAWQRGRCAMCQVTDWFDNHLVMDHDHQTGKIRGLLCRGCNGSEAHSTTPAFKAWRDGLNPAAVLGIDELYHSSFTGQASPAVPTPISADMGRRIADAMLD